MQPQKNMSGQRIPATVELVDPLHYQKNQYSQFSGGGDLLIKTNEHACVVVQEDIEATEMSPIYKGTAVQHLAVEGKKNVCEMEKLRWQLCANMIVASILQFMDNLKNCTLKDIDDVKQIVGYGIPYTGSGIGFYKLKLEFNKKQLNSLRKFQ